MVFYISGFCKRIGFMAWDGLLYASVLYVFGRKTGTYYERKV